MLVSVAATVVVPIVVAASPPTAAPAPNQYIDGSKSDCTRPDFEAVNLAINSAVVGPLAAVGVQPIDIQAGWVWANSARPFRAASGKVFASRVSYTDFPVNHDSHDYIFDLELDPGQEDVLSNVNGPNEEGGEFSSFDQIQKPTQLHNEWEINDFPMWVWPSIGDHVWLEGHHIFDCGHPTEVGDGDYYRTEIHPPRAVASMRDQFRTMPGTGTTPVQVKATDLYVHGKGGFATMQLYCGPELIVRPQPEDGCPDPVSHPHKGTPIDTNFEFDIPLPPKSPSDPQALLTTHMEVGPGNTLGTQPVLTPMPPDNPTVLRVKVPLAGSGAQPSDVYARKIYAGWMTPPVNLRHIQVGLHDGTLHEDTDLDPWDCDCSPFWMNVDRATNPQEWQGLAGHDRETDNGCFDGQDNHLNGWDDDGGCGNGRLGFNGPGYDFYVGNYMPFNVRFAAYDEDCWDRLFSPNSHFLPAVGAAMAGCYLDPTDPFSPEDDDLGVAGATYTSSEAANLYFYEDAPGPVPGRHVARNSNYEMGYNLHDVPLTTERTADLAVDHTCAPNPASAPGAFNCRIETTNRGPGLGDLVTVRFSMAARGPDINTTLDKSQYSIGTPTLTMEEVVANPPAPVPCNVFNDSVECPFIRSMPLAPAKAVVNVPVTVKSPGTFFTAANVHASLSTDPEVKESNNSSFTVETLPGTEIALSSSANPAAKGQEVTFSATVKPTGASTGAPTGTVQFRVGLGGDSFAALGPPVPLSGGKAVSTPISIDKVGTYRVVAEYSGDDEFGAGTQSLDQRIVVTPTETTVSSSANPKAPLEPVQFTARVDTVPPGMTTPTGTVQFKIDGTNLGGPVALSGGQATSSMVQTLGAGDHSITAEFRDASGGFEPSSGSLTQTVQAPARRATETRVTASENPSQPGEPVRFTATVETAVGTSIPVTPTGTVQFKVNGINLGGPVTLDDDGTATSSSISSLERGTHAITANYSGAPGFEPSSGSLQHGVDLSRATVVLTSSSDPSTEGEPVTFMVTVTDAEEEEEEEEEEVQPAANRRSFTAEGAEVAIIPAVAAQGPSPPAGTVQFKIDGQDLGPPVPLVDNRATSPPVSNLNVGDHTVTAEFLGSTSFGSASIMQTVVRLPAPTTTTPRAVPPPPPASPATPTRTTPALTGSDVAELIASALFLVVLGSFVVVANGRRVGRNRGAERP